MIPDASAGSNQLGANEIVTAQVTCPSGLAAFAGQEAPINRARARTARMLWPERRAAQTLYDVHRDADNIAGSSPTCVIAMAFPFGSARRMPTTYAAPCWIDPRPRPHAQRTTIVILQRRETSPSVCVSLLHCN